MSDYYNIFWSIFTTLSFFYEATKTDSITLTLAAISTIATIGVIIKELNKPDPPSDRRMTNLYWSAIVLNLLFGYLFDVGTVSRDQLIVVLGVTIVEQYVALGIDLFFSKQPVDVQPQPQTPMHV